MTDKPAFSTATLSGLYLVAALLTAIAGDSSLGFFVPTGYLALFGCMLLLWKRWPENRGITVLIPVAVIARLFFLLWYPAGDDIFRYIWEGRIQSAGFNPFTTPPSAEILASLRDPAWEMINHKSIAAIYWPFAQILFRFIAMISSSPPAFKTSFLLFDLATAAALMAIQRRSGFPARRTILYLLNPLVLLYTAGEGHVEIVMVFWLVMALYFLRIGKPAALYCCLGLAIMVKPIALPLVPLFIGRKTIRGIWALAMPLVLFIPFANDGVSFFQVPVLFATDFQYNGFFFTLYQRLLGTEISRVLSAATFLFLLGLVFFFVPGRLAAFGKGMAALLLCLPTFHPWYLQNITPLMVLFPSPAWLVLHASIVFSMHMFSPSITAPLWHNTGVVWLLEYSPFAIAGIWALARRHRHSTARWPAPRSISVIIPVLNEEKRIARCIESVRRQQVQAEIVVVDGGSTDGTARKIDNLNREHESDKGDFGPECIRLVESLPGRGMQIAAGVEQASGDVVLILHADSQLLPGTLSRALSTLGKRRDAVGGAFGAVYEASSLRFRINELLNNARAILLGISFGDQAQFFRGEALRESIPQFRLMEDIELSFRMKEKGAVLFMPHGVASSARMWHRAGYGRNFIRVIRLTASYVLRRRFGLVSRDCEEFYRAYYGT